jgi:hypothetical protein
MGAAMATGVRAATKAHFVFLSADGQAPVEELPKMFPGLDVADISLTTYERGEREWFRQFMSAGLRVYMRWLAGIRFELEGLYIFPTPFAKEVVDSIRADSFFFSFELIDRAMAGGMTVANAEMRYLKRRAGDSKVANIMQIRRVAREVAAYSRRKRTPSERS